MKKWVLIIFSIVMMLAVPALAGTGTAEEAQGVGHAAYTVEFTYDGCQYVMQGDSSVAMSEILSTLGLIGEVTAVAVSDTGLFSVSDETGEWAVTAHRAFDTAEWMKVTIGGAAYEIAVTDTQPAPDENGITLIKPEGGAVTYGIGNYNGEDVVYLFNDPDEGYRFVSYSVADASGNEIKVDEFSDLVTSEKSYYFRKQPATVTAEFVLANYAITVTQPTTGGTVSADKTAANEGDRIKLSYTEQSGYLFRNFVVTKAGGGTVEVTNSSQLEGVYNWGFTMPAEAVTVTAEYAVAHSITVSGVENAIISADASAVPDDSVQFSVDPNSGYIVKSVTAYKTDDPSVSVSVSAMTKTLYTFTMPDYPVTISAEIEKMPVSIEWDTTQCKVLYDDKGAGVGDTICFKVTPDAGCRVRTITVNGETNYGIEEYGVDPSLNNYQYKMTLKAPGNYSVKVVCDDGTDAGFAITRDIKMGGVSITNANGEEITRAEGGERIRIKVLESESVEYSSRFFYPSSEDAYRSHRTVNLTGDDTLVMPFCDMTVLLAGTPKVYSVTIVGGIEHGTVSAPSTAKYNSPVFVTVTPDADYALASLTYSVAGGEPVDIAKFEDEDEDEDEDDGDVYWFFMPAADAIVNARFEPISWHFSVNGAGTEYTIRSATGWDIFCGCLKDNARYNRFSGKTVKLDDDITVYCMAGDDDHDFCGVFDGQNHTITNKFTNDEDIALFQYVGTTKADPEDEKDTPSAIRNLHVTGTIDAHSPYAAGLIYKTCGNVTIENCRSSVVINSIDNDYINNYNHGGLVADNEGTLTIKGCVFDGKLLTTGGTTSCGGFVGSGGPVTISNSLYAPADLETGETEVLASNSATFNRTTSTLNNCFYTRPLGKAQGKAARTVTAGDTYVTVRDVALTGDTTSYSVSGITAYSGGGLSHGGNLYYGDGNTVSLTLGHSDRNGYTLTGYTVSAGTLSGNDTDGYTLTMPDEDVTVSAAFAQMQATPTATFTATDSDAGTLSGLVDGGEYSVTGVSPATFTASGETQALTCVSAGTLSIVRKGNGTTIADSEAQSIAVTQPDAPSAGKADCMAALNNDGKLTGVSAAMEYRKSDAESWTDGTGGDITGLAPGKYYVRVKASGTALASGNQTLTIAEYVASAQVATPTFRPAAGNYTGTQSVTISCETDGATIHYTTDDTEPTASSPVYSDAITVSATMTIKAIAVKDGMDNSVVAEATYTITPATYTLSVTAPTFDGVNYGYTQPEAKAITIENTGNSDATISGVTLSGVGKEAFTLNKTSGSTITAGSSDSTTYTIQPVAGLAVGTYTATITVTYNNNATANADVSFTVSPVGTVTTPVFSPAAGSYIGTQSVEITCGTDGATIYYTTDGTDPTTGSTKYSDKITVSADTTVKAIAVMEGWTDSAIASATYTITAPTYTLNITAPTFDAVTVGYAQPSAKAITITSTGNSNATISGVSLSGDHASNFTLVNGIASVTAGGTNTSYTIQPNSGLAAGTYTATITVTYDGNVTATASVSFTVNALPTYMVTYQVVGGTWSDNTTADKTETVQSGSKPTSVPTGMKASEGYTGGSWDTNPAETTINEAKTFTYTFTAIPTYTVTYKVVNGTWSDGKTTDITETVQSGSKPASVPTGMKAASGYTNGAWDTNPADATINEAKTFTYTFTAIPTYIVTYKVVNGTWSDDSTTDKTETVQSGSKPASVPAGMKAASGYTNGAWDTNPAEATITGATTFTYTFTAIPTYTVTYKVVNGTWSDDSTTDKTETVQSGSKPASVPAGMKAASGYTNGAWDTNPADATINEAKTFTYTFTAIPTYTVTYKVVNGTWSDGKTTDITETVQSGSKPASVPTGMKASSGYTNGAWDTNPAEATITGATTFTYTFTAIPTYTVTYKVVNGTWSDDSTTDKTETVQSGSKPASVPTGMKAGSGYTGGSWDTNPANTTITGATTFTYTFTAIPTYTVTYKVVNGTWSDGKTTDIKEIVQSGSKPASVPTGMKASSGYTGGSWYTNPAETTITEAKTFTYTFTTKQAATVTKAPTAKNPTYNGQAQALVEAGTAEGGTMVYALGENATTASADNLYTTSIPAKTNAGTYYVWYKVKGDGNHNDSTPAYTSVTISPASITNADVTLSATSLTWSGSEQTVTVNSVKIGDTTTLTTGTDYEVTNGTTGTAIGTYTVTVTGKGNYKDTASATWSIVAKSMTVRAENVTATYDGLSHGITVNVTDPASGAVIKYGTTAENCTSDVSPTITDVENSPLIVYYKVTATNYNEKTGFATVTIHKAGQTAPAEPTKASASGNSITLTAITNGEYKMGDGSWQESPTFTGLTVSTEYMFYQRLKEDGNHNASDSSPFATISTNDHAHNWGYQANGATITATCGNADGGHTGGLTAQLTVVKPAKTTYGDSNSANATITGSIDGVTTPGIVYKKGEETLNAAPTDAGTYTASITLGEGDKAAAATVEYTIAKADPTASAPAGLTATYGQILSDVEITNPTGNTEGTWEWADKATSVGSVGNHTFKANFTPEDTNNYKSVSNVDVTVTVSKAINPTTVTGTATVIRGGNTIDLADNVTLNGATGEVTYAVDGEANGCTLSGSVLTSGENTGSVTVNVTVATDDNYNALSAKPVTVTISDKGTQTITVSDVTVTYGDAGRKVNATTDGGGAISCAVKDGSADYIDVNASTGALNIKKVPTDGKAYVVVTAAETQTFAQATKEVTVTINKAAPTVTAPTARTLTYTGSAQALVNAGSATGGEMQYALGGNSATAPTGGWDTSIPAGTKTGTYYVWFKVVGDNNHNNTDPACITVTIAEASSLNTAEGEAGFKSEDNTSGVKGLDHEAVCKEMEAIANDDKTPVNDTQSKDVRITLESAAVPEKDVTEKEKTAIENAAKTVIPSSDAGTVNSDFLDVTIEKTVTIYENGTEVGKQTTTLKDPGRVVDIPVKYDLTGKHNLTVVRYHNGEAQVFTGLKEMPQSSDYKDGTFYVEGSGKDAVIHIYSSRFSTFALLTYGKEEYGNKALVITPPTAKQLAYTGEAQELVTAGTAKDGTMYYALGKDNAAAPDTGWSEKVPAGIDAGSYYVWYKAVGKDSSSESACVVTAIKKAQSVPETPAASKLTYNGKEQKLVRAGKPKSGKLVYAIGKDKKTAPKDADFKEAVPKGKNAGTYYVWYKMIGDAGHEDTDPAVMEAAIVPKTVRLSWSSTSFTYDGKSHVPTAAAKGIINGDKCSVKVSGSAKEPGTYTATAVKLSSTDYTLPKEKTVTFTITKKEEPKEPKETTPKGTSFRGLKLKGTAADGRIRLTWRKYPGAVKYVVYGSRCGKNYKMKKLKTVSGTGFNFKVRKAGYYRFYVKALDGSGKVLARAVTVHVANKGSNPRGIRLSKTGVKIKVGKKDRVTGTMVAAGSVSVHRKIRYESSNPGIAKVNSKTGEITGVKKGKCYVYAYAQNGVCEKVTVNVR